MDKLKMLLDGCKCGVFLAVNEHRDYYDSVQTKIMEIERNREMCGEGPLDEEIKSGMIQTGNIVELQFYPDTPIGSYSIYHYDIDKALDEALECLRTN